MRFGNIAAAVAAVAMLSIPSALAQSERPATPPLAFPSDRRDCPPGVGTAAPPTPRTNETTGSTTGSRSLSEQLSESKGVICPPAGVDPGITVPPIGGGRMPVIPPPGTPGGDPSIVPKQ
jgi:hypothetical protein